MRDAVAERLKALGFAVTVRENTGLRDLVEAFREFSVRALGGGAPPGVLRRPWHPGARQRGLAWT